MTFKKIREIIFVLLFVFVDRLAFAQKSISLSHVKNITEAQIDAEMVGAIQSKDNGETVRFFKKSKLGQNVASKNQFSGRKMPIVESSFFLENGRKTILPINEEVTHFNDSKVYTIKHDWVADEIVISSYDFKEGTLSNKQSLSYQHAETAANFLKNGYLVVSNTTEGSSTGTTLELSNENLEPIFTYKPLGGYSFYSVDCNKDNLVLAAGTSPKINLAILNKHTGNIRVEKVVSMPGFNISQIFAFESYIVLYGIDSQFVNYIFCFDSNLNQVWMKQALMAQTNQGVFCQPNADQTKFFYVSASLNSSKQVAFKAICIDARSGNELWGYNLIEDTKSSKILPSYDYRGFYITGFDYLSERNSLIITAANLFKSNGSPPQYEYRDSKLIVINDKGEARTSSILGTGKPFILSNKGKLRVVGMQKTHFYE